MTKQKTEIHLKAFNSFPESELWRLFIDGQHQDNGATLQQNDYLTGMLNGFEVLKLTLQQTLDHNLLEKLHDACLFDVSNKQSHPHSFRHNCASKKQLTMENERSNCSIAGINEISQFFINQNLLHPGNQLFSIQYEKMNNTGGKKIDLYATEKIIAASRKGCCSVHFLPVSYDIIKQTINAIFNTYKYDIKQTESTEKELTIIANTVRSIELLQPFAIANTRSIVFLLMNRLLLQNGFVPCILTNKNTLFGGTVEETVNNIKTGMQRFKDLQIKSSFAFINKLTIGDILADDNVFQTSFNHKLSQNPMHALAQINQLFILVRDGQLKIKFGKNLPLWKNIFYSLLKKPKKMLLNELKHAYLNTINRIVESGIHNSASLLTVLQNHQITTDKKDGIKDFELVV